MDQQLTSLMLDHLTKSLGYARKWHCESDMGFCTAGAPPRNNPTSIIIGLIYTCGQVPAELLQCSVLEKNKELIVDLEWSWWNW